MTMLIAVPTGVKFFNWIGTMWGGRISFRVPMLFSIGFLLNFLIGGVTGVMLAAPPIDFQVSDSYFLVSHFHYTMMGGSVFGIFAAIYFWWPEGLRAIRSARVARTAVFALMFVGFNLTFWPQFVVGLRGHAAPHRRLRVGPRMRHTEPRVVARLRRAGVRSGTSADRSRHSARGCSGAGYARPPAPHADVSRRRRLFSRRKPRRKAYASRSD